MSLGTIYDFVKDHLRNHLLENMGVLETGCGAALYRPIVNGMGCYYYGTDIFNDHYQEPESVDTYCSADSLPFTDKHFDIVFNQAAIDYMPSLKQTFEEAYRVLKHGGKFLIYTYNYKTLKIIDEACKMNDRSWEQTHHVFTSKQLEQQLHAAGFSVRNVSFQVDSWEIPNWALRVLKLLRLYKMFLRWRTRWRVFEAMKP